MHNEFDEGDMADPPPIGGDFSDFSSRRTWWHQVLREYGFYSCYVTFLLLESDKNLLNYLLESGKEIYLLARHTNSKSLVMLFSQQPNMNMPLGFHEKVWKAATLEHAKEGYSIKFAQHFNIDITKFPCMIVFKDIRSPKHILIPLNQTTTDETANTVRHIFSVISQAVSNSDDPLKALAIYQTKNNINEKGTALFSDIRSFAGKTLEKAMEAWIKSKIG